jgi:hypothetical protein
MITRGNVKTGPWIRSDLCLTCATDLGRVTNTCFGQCCPNCGAIPDALVPPVITTAKRYITTYEPTFMEVVFRGRETEGHWEWSGLEAKKNKEFFATHDIRISTAPIVMGVGIASGLF